MNIGIIGSGNVGGTTLWAKQGHHLLFSCSRDQQKLEPLALLLLRIKLAQPQPEQDLAFKLLRR